MSSQPVLEKEGSAKLQELIPDLVHKLSQPEDILGPSTKVDTQDLITNGISATKEIQAENSLLGVAWDNLLRKLSLTDSDLAKKSPGEFLSTKDESLIRETILKLYTGSTSTRTDNPLLPYYQEASPNLQALAQEVENVGTYSRQVMGFDQAGDATWYRTLSNIPLYTPRITTTGTNNDQTQFILPLDREPTLEAHSSQISEMIGKYGLRGIDEKYYLVVQDQESNEKLAQLVLEQPALARLFLAEELALHQEDLVHNLRSKLNKVAKEKLPSVEQELNGINNKLRVAVYAQLEKLLSINEKLYIAIPEINSDTQHRQLNFEVTKEKDFLLFAWNEPTGMREVPFIPHKVAVKKSPDGSEVLFDPSPKDMPEWISLRSPRNNNQISFAEHLFHAMRIATQTQIENGNAEELSNIQKQLNGLTDENTTTAQFFSQMPTLKWGSTDSSSYERRLVISTEPIEEIDL